MWGSPDPGRPHGRDRRGRQGRAPARRRTCSRTAPTSWSPTSTSRRSRRCAATYPQVDVAPDAEALVKGDLDVYAPCALGGALDELDRRVAERRRSSAAAANNQLADEGEHGTADRLLERGITYAPDFLVNAGGVIQVSDELHGFDFERARARPPAIFDHTRAVLRLAAERGISPAVAADRIAEERMAAVGNPAGSGSRPAERVPARGARAAATAPWRGGAGRRAPVTAKLAITL